jgi:hypothetical protein
MDRYFVVIDDIWEPQSWETIKLALAFEVAQEVDEVYKIQPLSYDNSKMLFYTRLFGEDKCPNNHLDGLSDRILKKCGGVPSRWQVFYWVNQENNGLRCATLLVSVKIRMIGICKILCLYCLLVTMTFLVI